MSLFTWMGRRRRERERAEEIRAHVELYTEELIARGRTPEAARREARLAFGNMRTPIEEIQHMDRLRVLDVLGRDVRHAIRVLIKTPVFTVTALVTLALVIGAGTAVFSLADSILFRPLPYAEPERLALIERVTLPAGERAGSVDGATWEAVRDHVTSLDAAVYGSGSGANLVVGNAATFIRQHRVSAGFFRVLGVAAARGREFTPEEDRPGGQAVTILSHDLWRGVFRADPEIVGKSILLRGEPHAVIGVMPAGFQDIAVADLWTPLRGSSTGEGSGTNFRVIVRLKPEATWEQVRSEFAAINEAAFRLFRKRDGISFALDVRPMQDALVAGVRDSIVMLGWAVGTVLVMACVNLAALLLSRGGSRSKEIATRMALGSGRRAIVRQLMVEAVLLALAGGALGIAVGWVGLESLKAIGGQTFEEWSRVTLDGRVLLASVALSLLTSLLFGLVPAWQSSRVDVQAALADGGSRSVAGGSKHWVRRTLVVAQVALCVTMLVTAGLLLRTFMNLRQLDPGFEPRGLVTASASMQDARYRTAAAITRLFDESLRRLRATPGVEAAAVSLELPYDRLLNRSFRFPEMAPGDSSMTTAAYITPGFVDTLRIPLRAGRDVLDTDTASAPRVVLVNATFARIYSRDQPAIGRRLRIAGEEREIVGITGDVQQQRFLSIDGTAPGPLTSLPIVFVPAAQTADGDFRGVHTWFEPVWSVRARTQADAAWAVREAIHAVDPLLPLSGQRAMTEVIAGAMSQQRLLFALVGALAGAALLLAAIGIYGLLAHSIGERRREFGIRIALGATPAETVRGVAMGGIVLAAAGAVAGTLLSLPAARLVQASLVGVSERDPLTYAGVIVFLLSVAAIASVIPALRILKLDPASTLRG